MECNKFCASREDINSQPMSSLGVQDVVYFLPLSIAYLYVSLMFSSPLHVDVYCFFHLNLQAFQSLETFKTQHGDKPFTLTHCWMMICECPKFKDQYATQKKGGRPAVVVEPSEAEK